jgi:hypothetical protein
VKVPFGLTGFLKILTICLNNLNIKNMSITKTDPLFYEVKTEGGLTALLNKKQIVSAINSSKMWTHITITNGETIIANCDFDDLSSHLAKLKHDSSD